MKFNIICIDPPWEVKKLTHPTRPNQVSMDYTTIPLQDIARLPVNELANGGCWCFLWTTQKYLFEAKQILEGWGFHYLLTMVWEKTYGKSPGMPLYGFRWNAEFILVGYKGKPDVWIKGKSLIPAVFQAENLGHSQKPDRFYKLVSSLGEPRIDIFARKQRDGWLAIGYDITGRDIREDMELVASI